MKPNTATSRGKVREAKAPARNARAPKNEKPDHGPSLGYNPEFCDLVRRLGSAGLSREEMPARLCIHAQILDKWAAAHPEFAEAMDCALTFSQAWWESLGRCALLMDEDFDGEAYIDQMTSRFPNDYQR